MDEKRKSWGYFALLGLLLALMVAVFWSGLGDFLSLSRLSENRVLLANFVDQHYGLAIFLFMLVYIVVIALSIPGGAVLTIGGGFLFGVWLGLLLVVIAATIGAVILFSIAKTTLGEALRQKAGEGIKKLEQGFTRNAFYYLLFLRLVPLFPFWLVNLAPALLGVPLSIYVSATFLGIIPGSFAFAFLGAGLDSILTQHQKIYHQCLEQTPAANCAATPSIGDLLTLDLVLALSALGLIALLPILLKKRIESI